MEQDSKTKVTARDLVVMVIVIIIATLSVVVILTKVATL